MIDKTFTTLDSLETDLSRIAGMPELIQEERAALRAAEFIERTRKEAHLSQAALAERIGVSQARVSQMEKGQGRYGASIALLERVAVACGGTLRLSFTKNEP